MKTRKSAWLLVLVLLFVTIAGCSSNNGGNETTNTNDNGFKVGSDASEEPAKDVTLTLSIWGDDARKALYEDLMKTFNEQNPNIKVDVLLIPFAEYQQKLSIMLASKTAPDVVWLAERMVPQFMGSGQLMDVASVKEDSAYNFDDIYPSTLDLYRDGEKLYGVGFAIGPKELFFNKTLFEEKGLKTPLELYKEGDWTYDEFLKAAEAISDPDKGVYGVNLFGSNNSWKNWQDALMDTIWAFGGDIFNEDKTAFALNSPGGEQALQFFNDLIYKYNVHPQPGDQTTFESGKLGMVRNTYSYSTNARSITDFEWDIAPMPTGPNADAPTAVGMAGYSVTKDTKHPEEAMKLFKYMTSADVMSQLTGMFQPPRKSVSESDAFLDVGKPSREGMMAALVDPMAKGVELQPFHENWQQIDVKIQTILDYLYTQDSTVKEVLDLMDKEVGPLVK
ncbi:sugar ABC transporter substrate-binding protein [Paenibacillus sp. HB172176]|uniref:ABC transporter substrate-binding protein n=1 Tax=Paenibacillus sp. HB172176 TaxID=2493690 RepID=UPI00143A6D2A|nr:sugar ABC transporter substrate-binding protein [Paenibacillus sp. HB172176]